MVVPLVRKLQRLRAREMGLESLRPWDLSVDPLRSTTASTLRPNRGVDRMAAWKSPAGWTPVLPDF